jgi:hypothetical protein
MKLIKINTNHYIVVDNSLDFSETDYYWDDKQKEIRTGSNNHVTGGYKIKITHSTQPLECDKMWTPVNGKQWMCNTMLCCGKILNLKTKPISLQEVKELIGEVDVEKKMISPYPLNTQNDVDWCNGYQRGYTQALEDNKEKKYTNEDMLTIRNQLVTMLPVGDVAAWDMIQAVSKYTKWLDEYIESLQPKTEWEVEFINGKLTLKQ